MPTLFWGTYLLLWLVVLAQGMLIILLYRHFGLSSLNTAAVQRDGLPIGTVAPSVQGIPATGKTMEWKPDPTKFSLVAFVSVNCGPCGVIIPYINRVAQEYASLLSVMYISFGSEDGIQKLEEKYSPPPEIVTLAEGDYHAFERYGVRVTPFAFLIDHKGAVIAKGLCDKWERLAQILQTANIEITQDNVEKVAVR